MSWSSARSVMPVARASFARGLSSEENSSVSPGSMSFRRKLSSVTRKGLASLRACLIRYFISFLFTRSPRPVRRERGHRSCPWRCSSRPVRSPGWVVVVTRRLAVYHVSPWRRGDTGPARVAEARRPGRGGGREWVGPDRLREDQFSGTRWTAAVEWCHEPKAGWLEGDDDSQDHNNDSVDGCGDPPPLRESAPGPGGMGANPEAGARRERSRRAGRPARHAGLHGRPCGVPGRDREPPLAS